MSDKIIDLFKKKKEKEVRKTKAEDDGVFYHEEKENTLKPNFDKNTYFEEIMKANKRKKEEMANKRKQDNKKVKRNYRIKSDKDE